MNARRNRIECLCTVLVLLAAGWIWLAFGLPDWMPNEVLVVLLYGTLLGQSALASAWIALGPFSFAPRLSLATLWLAAVVLAIGFNHFVQDELASEFDVFSTLALAVLGQVTVIAVPLWLIANWCGVRLIGADELESNFRRSDRQVGIREFLIVTGVVAIFFGGARFSAGDLSESRINWRVVQIHGFAMLFSGALAILTMIVIRKSWFWPLLIASLLVIGLTVVEIAVIYRINQSGTLSDGAYWACCLVNLTQSTWMIGILSVLKLGGYRLASSASSMAASTRNFNQPE